MTRDDSPDLYGWYLDNFYYDHTENVKYRDESVERYKEWFQENFEDNVDRTWNPENIARPDDDSAEMDYEIYLLQQKTAAQDK